MNWPVVLSSSAEVGLHGVDPYGHRYTADLRMTGINGRQATVRTGWIVQPDEDVVRLVTLWVEE